MHMKHSWKILVTIVAIGACVFILNTGAVSTWPTALYAFMPTTSMEPDIKAGDVFTVDRTVPFRSVNIGDVVVYWRDYDRIAHGVVNHTADEMFTKGNNPPWSEAESVTHDQYVGIVKDVYEIGALNALFDHMPLGNLMQFPNNVLLLAIVMLVVTLSFLRKKQPKRMFQPDA